MKKIIFPLLLSAVMLCGCSKTDVTTDSVQVSDNSCSFNYEGGSTTVMVTASQPWHAECTASWVSFQENANSITITAEANSGSAERVGYISIISGNSAASIDVYQAGTTLKPVVYRKIPSYIHSQDGNYIGGITVPLLDESGRVTVQFVVLFDIRNDKQIEFGPYSYDVYNLESVSAVANNGDMYITSGSGVTYYFNSTDASLTQFMTKGNVYQCSADGTIAVGQIPTPNPDPDEMGACYIPTKWVNGIPQTLELPETPARPSYEGWYGGCIARGCSADGKIVMATEWNGFDMFMLWWDENNNVHRVAEDVYKTTKVDIMTNEGVTGIYYLVEGMITTNCPHHITPSGKWMCGIFYADKIDEDGRIVKTYYPAFYDVEELKTYIFWDYPDGSALYVREDGIGFIRTDARFGIQDDITISDYVTVDVKNLSTIGTTQEWFFDNYGIYPPAKSLVYGFSEDYKVVILQDAYIYDRR